MIPSSRSRSLARNSTVGADTHIVDQEVDHYASLLSESEDLCSCVGLRKIGSQHLDADAMRRAESSCVSSQAVVRV